MLVIFCTLKVMKNSYTYYAVCDWPGCGGDGDQNMTSFLIITDTKTVVFDCSELVTHTQLSSGFTKLYYPLVQSHYWSWTFQLFHLMGISSYLLHTWYHRNSSNEFQGNGVVCSVQWIPLRSPLSLVLRRGPWISGRTGFAVEGVCGATRLLWLWCLRACLPTRRRRLLNEARARTSKTITAYQCDSPSKLAIPEPPS